MFIKQRQVRRSSKFTSRWSRASSRRREFMASLYTTGVIQFFLFWALLYGAYQSAMAMNTRFPDVVWYARFAIPLLMIIIALVVLRVLVGNVKQAIDYHRNPPRT